MRLCTAIKRLLVAIYLLSTSSGMAEPISFSQQMMGTTVQIMVAEADLNGIEPSIAATFDEMERLVSLLSEWEQKSDISFVNRLASRGPVRVSSELFSVIQLSLAVADRSFGAFDPTWAALRTLRPNANAKERRERAKLVNWRDVAINPEASTVQFKSPTTQLGLGGIAKGYIADRAAAFLKSRGITNFVVDAGGDLVVSGHREAHTAWRLAIQHPRQPTAVLGRAHPGTGALVTSGDYERFKFINGRRVHHIIDPRTGAVARQAIAVSVRAPTAALADALATAAFVLGPSQGIRLLDSHKSTHGNGVAGIIVGADGVIFSSRDASQYFTLDTRQITVTP